MVVAATQHRLQSGQRYLDVSHMLYSMVYLVSTLEQLKLRWEHTFGLKTRPNLCQLYIFMRCLRENMMSKPYIQLINLTEHYDGEILT